MSFTASQAEARLRNLGEHRWNLISEISHEGANDGIGPVLICAMMLRETSMSNITGDGGHGRGAMQIDDRFHQSWLAAHAGCPSGSWIPKYSSALPKGRVPTLTAQIDYAIVLLRSNMAFAKSAGVPSQHRLRFAIAAYNCGAGNAIAAYRAGGISNIDARTAGRDYSKDVLVNVDVVRRVAQKLGWDQ